MFFKFTMQEPLKPYVFPHKANASFDSLVPNFGLQTPSPSKRPNDIFDALEAAATPPSVKPRVARQMAKLQTSASSKLFYDEDYDDDLKAALDALDSVQQFAAAHGGKKAADGESPLNDEDTTPGQKLALFLREQLLQREESRHKAEERAENALSLLRSKDLQWNSLQDECAVLRQHVQDAAFKSSSLEEEILRLTAENKRLRDEVSCAEEKAFNYRDMADKYKIEAGKIAQETNIKLEKTQQRLAELEVQAHLASYGESPSNAKLRDDDENELQEEENLCDASDIFDDVDGQTGKAAPTQVGDDEALSIDSDDIVSEAAATLRFVSRKTRREMQTEKDVFASTLPASIEVAALSSQKEKLLRSEIATLGRKSEQANELLMKANYAMQILQTKLRKERNNCAALQEERNLLQSQLASLQRRPSIDPQRLQAVLQELNACRTKIESLMEERVELTNRLEQSEKHIISQTQKHDADQAAAAMEASERLATEKVRSELLERQVRELVEKVGEAASNAAQMSSAKDLAAEARDRAVQLAAQVDAHRTAIAEKDVEISRLTEVAQAFGTQLMSSREALAVSKSETERLKNENAGLQGQLEALHQTVEDMEREGGVLERLAGGQAELVGKLRQAEAAASTAYAAAESSRAEAVEYRRQVMELETELESVRAELSAVLCRQENVQSAASAAANQLATLSESHARLEKELERSLEENKHSKASLNDLMDRVSREKSEKSTVLLELQHVKEEVEILRLERKTLEEDLINASDALKESENEIMTLQDHKSSLHAEVEDLKARCHRQDASLAALMGECQTLRCAGTATEDTNQALVDNMCDMNGIIDAMSAVQHQNKILAEECDAANLRVSRTASERDALALGRRALERELELERDRLASVQSSLEIHQAESESLRADHAVASRQLKALEEAHGRLRSELSELQRRELESRSEAVAANAQNDRLQADIARLSADMDRTTARMKAAQDEIDALRAEREEHGRREIELQAMLEEERRHRSLAEGKLLLARQKDQRIQRASEALTEVQNEIALTMREALEMKQEKEDAEARCEALAQRCVDLQGRADEAEAELEDLKRTTEELQRQVEKWKQTSIDLAPRADRAEDLEERLRQLELRCRETGAWCDDVTEQLHAKSQELDKALQEAQDAQEREETLVSELKRTQERCSAAETTNHSTALALEEAERRLSELREEFAALQKCFTDTSGKLVEVQGGRNEALKRLDEAESQLEISQREVQRLRASLSNVESSKRSMEAELSERLSTAEATIRELNVRMEDSQESYRKRITELQCSVEAGTVTCSSLCAKVEKAVEKEREATSACERAEASADKSEKEKKEALEKLAQVECKLEQAIKARDDLREETAEHVRSVQQLEIQCGFLREQVDILQNAASQDLTLTEDVRERLQESYAEQQRLREKAAAAENSNAELEARIQRTLDDVRALKEALNEKDAALNAYVKEMQILQSRMEELRETLSQAEHRATASEHRTHLVEMLKDQAQQELDAQKNLLMQAHADVSMAKEAARAAEEARRKVEADTARALQTSITGHRALLERIEAAVIIESSSGGCGAVSRDVDRLYQALRDIDVLKQDMVESKPTSGKNTDTAIGLLRSEEENGLRREISDVGISEDAVAEARSQLLSRLLSVQRGVAQIAQEQRDKDKEQERKAEEAERAYQGQLNCWNEEKFVMKALCKLALAITMEQVGEDAPREGERPCEVAIQLEPMAAKHADALSRLGLQSVWLSLLRLARDTPSPHRRASFEEVERWRGEASALERKLQKLQGTLAVTIDRTQSIASSIAWSLGDFQDKNSDNTVEAGSREGLMPSAVAAGREPEEKQLEICLGRLDVVVKRMLRRHRTLSRHVNASLGRDVIEMKRKVDAGPQILNENGSIPAHWHAPPPVPTSKNGIVENGTPLRARFGRTSS